jgi:hypothetical protein
MVGVANVAIVLQNKLNKFKNTGTTISEIKKINDEIFRIWQKIPAGNTTPLLRQTYTIQALETGSAQAQHFAAALRMNMSSTKLLDSHLKTEMSVIDDVKWFTTRLQQTYQAYNDSTYILPTPTQQPKTDAKKSNSTTTQKGMLSCSTCGFSQHDSSGICKFWTENGQPKVSNIAWSEVNGNKPFNTFREKCENFQKMNLEKQNLLKRQVSDYISLKEWAIKGQSNETQSSQTKPPPVKDNKPVATLIASSSSKSVKVVRDGKIKNLPVAAKISAIHSNCFPSLIKGEEERKINKFEIIVSLKDSKEIKLLLDSGSQINLISLEMASHLGLTLKYLDKENIQILRGIGENNKNNIEIIAEVLQDITL